MLRALEDLFIINIDDAMAKSVTNMLLSHSNWAKHMIKQAFEENGSKETFKNFKAYHIEFVNLLLTNLVNQGVETLDYQDILFITAMGNLKHLKNRDNARLIYKIGLAGMDKLPPHLEEQENQMYKDVAVISYYDNMSKTILNKKSEDEVREELLKRGIDLEKVLDRLEEVIDVQNSEQMTE